LFLISNPTEPYFIWNFSSLGRHPSGRIKLRADLKYSNFSSNLNPFGLDPLGTAPPPSLGGLGAAPRRWWGGIGQAIATPGSLTAMAVHFSVIGRKAGKGHPKLTGVSPGCVAVGRPAHGLDSAHCLILFQILFLFNSQKIV
jgi:hypothetical protein